MKNEREIIMKKLLFYFVTILTIIGLLFAMQKNTFAAITTTDDIKIEVYADASVARTDKLVFVPIRTSDVMASGIGDNFTGRITATLSYDSSVLSLSDYSRNDDWTTTINNNTITFETTHFKIDSLITTLYFDVNNQTDNDVTTKISFSNVNININDEYQNTYDLIETNTFTITAQTSGGGTDDPAGGNEVPSDENTITGDDSETEDPTYENTAEDPQSKNKNEAGKQDGKITDKTVAKSPIPQTGVSIAIFLVIAILSAIGIYTYIKDRKMLK